MLGGRCHNLDDLMQRLVKLSETQLVYVIVVVVVAVVVVVVVEVVVVVVVVIIVVVVVVFSFGIKHSHNMTTYPIQVKIRNPSLASITI